MACRPAPIQVTWIGYPNTTGLPAIYYRITDSLADTPDTNQKHVEELVRLPESFLCYTPSPEAGPVCPTPAISNGFVTIGSFNDLAKITPKVLQVWARILCAVPNSRLMVKCKPFCCDSIRQKFLTTLEELGLEPLRVDLLPLIHLNHDHMQAYSLMDISLDTFPYAGTTTTCESLYMGVPCVTMAGSVHAHNVGVSLLTKVGLGRLVAKTEDEYVSLALDLASDVSALQELRMSLRELMIKSPVCDGESFTRSLESAYRTMWRRYCDGDSPALKRLELLADQPGSNKEDLETAVKLADPRAQRANAIAEEDNQAPIKVNATPEEGGQPQIIMANGVSSPADNQALIATVQQPQIMVNGGIQIESLLDDKDDEASSLPPSQCPEIEEFRTLLRQQKVLNNLTEQALRKSQPLVISKLTHEKAELLTAQDLMGTSKVEQLCLQVLSMRICPGGGVVDVPVIDNSATSEETNQSNAKSSPAASSILDTDLPEIVGVIRSSRDVINKLVELLHQKFPTVAKIQLNRKVREISDFVDNRWQVKKEVLDKLGLTSSPVNHPQKTKATASPSLPQKTKAAAKLPQKTKGISMYFSKRCLPPEEAINAQAASPELRLKSKTVQGNSVATGAPQVDLFPSTK
ncbi:hypothetical protein ACQ4PT_028877 [Festuca glaucescens]